MSAELFIPIKFRCSITLKPNELTGDFEKTILKKLKSKYENICSKYGYIKNNSIKIVKRSIGIIKSQHFNGNISFDIVCIAEICNPIQGSIIKCRVKAKNSLGLLCEGGYEGNHQILEIIVPKISAGIQSEINLDTIAINQEIKIEVCGKKYQLYDTHISIIGRAIKNKEEFIKNAPLVDADAEGDEVIINEEDEIIDDNYDEDNSEINQEEKDEDELDEEEVKKVIIDDDEEDDDENPEEEEDELSDVEPDEEFNDEEDNYTGGGYDDDD
jgi:DNA-directed RNA polymerase subunit E'/Rpb7